MPIHVAILKRPYLEAILDRRKTVEARLTRTAMPPYGKIASGELMFLKASGGPFMATASAGSVVAERDLTPERFDALRTRFQPAVGGTDEFWNQRRATTRYATFTELTDVQPCSVGPLYRVANMKAWYVLPAELSPVQDVVLTEAALRNRYVTLDRASDALRAGEVNLRLPPSGGEAAVVRSGFVGKRLRWRGWVPHFEAACVGIGWRVRFTHMNGPAGVEGVAPTFEVRFLPPVDTAAVACADVPAGP